MCMSLVGSSLALHQPIQQGKRYERIDRGRRRVGPYHAPQRRAIYARLEEASRTPSITGLYQ